MKTQILKSQDRGHTRAGWLDSRHTFSFGEYYNPNRMGLGPLRVINEDIVAPGQGFPTHPHRDMEILTYIVSGAVAHRDTLGTESVIGVGELQRMTAGTGIRHSEYNPSPTEPLHLLQIWIEPAKEGLEPSYEQKAIADNGPGSRLALVASGKATDGTLFLNQDASVLRGRVAGDGETTYQFAAGRLGWLQVVKGSLRVGSDTLEAGDGAALQAGAAEDGLLRVTGSGDGDANAAAEFLLFDLPR